MSLKQVYSKLNDDVMVEVKYFLLYVVKFPISEATVEFLDSVTDSIMRKKVAFFKESNSSDTVDVAEEFVFMKLVRLSVETITNRKSFKRVCT